MLAKIVDLANGHVHILALYRRPFANGLASAHEGLAVLGQLRGLLVSVRSRCDGDVAVEPAPQPCHDSRVSAHRPLVRSLLEQGACC